MAITYSEYFKRFRVVLLVACMILAVFFIAMGLYHAQRVKKYFENAKLVRGVIESKNVRKVRSYKSSYYNYQLCIAYIDPELKNNQLVCTSEYVDESYFDKVKEGDKIDFFYLPEERVVYDNNVEYKGSVIIKDMIKKKKREPFYPIALLGLVFALIGILPYGFIYIKRRIKQNATIIVL